MRIGIGGSAFRTLTETQKQGLHDGHRGQFELHWAFTDKGMATTQVHFIDPCGGMLLVVCDDGSRVLFGNQIGVGTTNDVLQRLFEVLEDGAIDYFVPAGMDSEGSVGPEDISEFFPVKCCLELSGQGDAYPQSYLNFRGEREVETVEHDDIMEFGETQIRLLAARTPHETPGGLLRPVVMRVTHGGGDDARSVICAGRTKGTDWLEIMEAEEITADCLIVDGRHPLDLIITSRPKGNVSAEHLRKMAPRTVILGADAGGAHELRMAAREFFGHMVGLNPGGEGFVEVKKTAWCSLTAGSGRVAIAQEPRAIGKVA
jgi:hypothetical protein